MNDVKNILSRINSGDPSATDELLPLVYDELRLLAGQWLGSENAGHTLQPTALVHEAYLRLVGNKESQHWDNRRHFFAAAAKAMRRILIDHARRKKSLKRGGGLQRAFLESAAINVLDEMEDRLDLETALSEFDTEFPAQSQVLQLRLFSGMSHTEVAQTLGISDSTAKRHWRFARVWLHRRLAIEPT